MSGCCNEQGCTRKKPYKIRRGPFTGRWFLVTDYVIKNLPAQVAGAPPLMVVSRKHDINDELIAALLDAGWTPPPEDGGNAADDDLE